MNKYQLFFLLGFMVIPIAGQTQIRSFSLGLSPNYTVIGNNTYQEDITYLALPGTMNPGQITTSAIVHERYTERVGFNFDSRVDFYITPRFFLSGGLGISHLMFRRTFSIESSIQAPPDSEIEFPTDIVGQPFGPITPSPDIPGRSEKVGETSVWYLQLPVLAGITTLKEKIQIRGGMNFSYTLRATEYKQSVQVTGGQPVSYTLATTKDIITDTFEPLQTSVLVEGSYLISKRFSLDVSAQSFLTPFYKDRKTKF